MSKTTYTINEIEQAFKLVREELAREFGIKVAEGDAYRIRDIEKDVVAMLQRSQRQPAPAPRKRPSLEALKTADLNAFNDILFG